MSPILPTSYFGSIAYFTELSKHEKVIIDADEHFPKQTYRNRCDILAGDGILSLSIPTKKLSGSKTKTRDVVLSNDENWRIRHWRAIVSAYQASPYFDHYGSEVHELLMSKEQHLFQLNLKITRRLIDWLALGTEIEESVEFHQFNEDDLRISLSDKDAYKEKIKSPYIQVFPGTENFCESLSIMDAIFCEGPMARKLLIN